MTVLSLSDDRALESNTENTETAVAIPDQSGGQMEAKLDQKQVEDHVETAKGPAVHNIEADTPRKVSALDHHIKYSENEYLKKWLKVKDKQYVRKVKEEKRKKKEEREKIIQEANEKLEKRIMAQKQFESWVRSKNKEMNRKHKEDRSKQMMMTRGDQKEAVFPGRSVHIKTLHSSMDSTKSFEENHNKDVDTSYQEEQEEWRPPQTKFMYKRPISGRIKLYYQPKEKSAEVCHPGQKLMQVRGKSPVAKHTDLDNDDHNEKDVYRKSRSSSPEYRTRKTDGRSSAGKRETLVERQTKNEISWELRYLEKKRMAESERPSTAFGEGSAGSAKQNNELGKRPATAPASRNVMPRPKTTVYSPRRAKMSPRSDEARASSSLSSSLPFPPEKGIPVYVADRQRKLFGDTMSFSETDQRELLQDVLVQEGVADVVEGCDEQSNNMDSESNGVRGEEHANKPGHSSQRASKEFINEARSKCEGGGCDEKMFVKYAAFETVRNSKSEEIEEHLDSDLSLDSDSDEDNYSATDPDGKSLTKQEVNQNETLEAQTCNGKASDKIGERNDSNRGSKQESAEGSVSGEISKSNSIVSDITSLQDVEERHKDAEDLRERCKS